MLARTKLDQEQRDHLNVVHFSAGLLNHLIENLLDFSRLEKKQLTLNQEEFSLASTLKYLATFFNEFARQKNIKFNMDVDGSLPQRIVLDKARFSQILINLVNNAIKFTSAEKSVSISIRNYNGEQCCSRVERELKADSNMIIEVSDEGIGMSNENVAKLFQAFFQVERNSVQGSGLGLYICRELVHLMHGHVCCRSELGRGTTFTLVIPLIAASNQEEPDDPEHLTSKSRVNSVIQNRRVLVAEDNKVNQMVITNMLKRLNCKFDIVGDGQQAVDAFEQGDYFVVLMDLMMPVMDGFEATRRITSSARYAVSRPRVIALTASVTEDEVQAALTAGCHSVISKPTKLEILSETIDAASCFFRQSNRPSFVIGSPFHDSPL